MLLGTQPTQKFQSTQPTHLLMSTGRGAFDLQGGGSQTFAGFCFFFFLTSRADSAGSGICSFYGYITR